MKVNGDSALSTGKELIFSLMETAIQVNIKRANLMAEASINGLMGKCI